MLARNDPRIRRALDQLAAALESASSRAQEGAFAFSERYVSPCLASVRTCLAAASEPCRACWEEEEQRRRRQQQAARGRAELSFDFYDDWEADEEADPLLGGDDAGDEEPVSPAGGSVSGGSGWFRGRARERTMTYGAIGGGGPAGKGGGGGGGKGKQRMVAPPPDEDDAPIIRSSSYFGFLESLPFRLGARGLRYQPSIADLQDHPGSRRRFSEEQPLTDGSDADEAEATKAKAKAPAMRKRSGTQGSGHTTDSFSSRGDIFPSEDEMDDAVPLDDEFALHLERRTTGHGSQEDHASGSSGRNRSSAASSLLSRGSGGRKPRSANRLPPPENRILSPASLFGTSAQMDGHDEGHRRVPQRSRSSPELDNVASAQFSAVKRLPLLNGSAEVAASVPTEVAYLPPPVESKPPAVESKLPPDAPMPPQSTPINDSVHTPTDTQPSPADQRWVAAALPNFSRSPT
jgi:hypothetical protein